MTIAIGSKLWMFDENRRVYAKTENKFAGRTIWREHWRPMKVVGETRVSWLVGFEGSALPLQPHMLRKLPKTPPPAARPGTAATPSNRMGDYLPERIAKAFPLRKQPK